VHMLAPILDVGGSTAVSYGHVVLRSDLLRSRHNGTL
jgi:hypothetical protein